MIVVNDTNRGVFMLTREFNMLSGLHQKCNVVLKPVLGNMDPGIFEPANPNII